MKLSEGYIIREIAGNQVAIPIGQSVVDYKSMLHLNETAAFILQQIAEGISYEELCQRMQKEYEFRENEQDIMHTDLDVFLKKVKELGVIEV